MKGKEQIMGEKTKVVLFVVLTFVGGIVMYAGCGGSGC